MPALTRKLRPEDQKALSEFFKGLSDESLKMMNRFGRANQAGQAGQIAEEQVKLDPKGEQGFVVESEGEIQGYGFLRFFPDKPQKRTTCSLGIIVSDKAQGQGLGRQLMEFMIEEAKKLGMKKIWLGTYTVNEKALKLYQSLGFQAEGIFMADEFFEGKPYHTVSMALFLDGTGEELKRERNALLDKLSA